MIKRLLVAAAILGTTSSAFALTADKIGTDRPIVPSGTDGVPSALVADYEYNSGGAIDIVPTTGGSWDGWGEWFIVTVLNDSGQDVLLTELGFPCAGLITSDYGWVVWTGMGGLMPPAGDAMTADYHGMFTPVDPDDTVFPPTVYSYVDVLAENIIIANGEYYTVGYQNPGVGGQVDFNGTVTWAWYTGFWDADDFYGRTAVIQVKGDYVGAVPVETGSWSKIKDLF